MNFKSFFQSLGQFFLTVDQNNFFNKIQFLFFCILVDMSGTITLPSPSRNISGKKKDQISWNLGNSATETEHENKNNSRVSSNSKN